MHSVSARSFTMRFALLAALVLPLDLQAQRRIDGNTLISDTLPAARIEVAPGWSYEGTQKFSLGESLDVEQHLFIQRDGLLIKRFLLLQFEGYRPTNSHVYDYSADSTVSHGDVKLYARNWTIEIPRVEPRPESDRARTRGFLRRKGMEWPAEAARQRLTYLYETPARHELLVLYEEDLTEYGLTHAEVSNGTVPPARLRAMRDEVTRRALAAFTITPAP